MRNLRRFPALQLEGFTQTVPVEKFKSTERFAVEKQSKTGYQVCLA
jgi:hypothetical protein